MRPIEQVHRQILAGNVLGPNGTWVPRAEALKKKRIQLKHILDGEVEIDGKWVKLSSFNTSAKKPFRVEKEHITGNSDNLNSLKQNISHSPIKPKKSVAPLGLSQLNSSNPQETSKTTPTTIGHHAPPSKNGEDHSSDTPQEKQTITIRTIPLGKETTLTISESRAGNALVAICSIQGFIDQTNAEELNAQIMSMLDFGVRFFIIDFEHTNLIGSAGWGVLAVASRLIKTSQGHLLLCSMSPDIEESFLLLQFNEVIDARKTMSDCLDAIDLFLKEQQLQNDSEPVNKDSFHFFGESFEDLPLHEKIKSIISHNGPIGFFAIAKKLKSPEYGEVKTDPLKLYFTLKELNLESKWKRVRFYRSC